MDSPIRFSSTVPQSKEGRYARLASPQTTRGFRATLTAESITGFQYHWIRQKPIPCLISGCQFCSRQVRYRGYASAEVWHLNPAQSAYTFEHCMLELSEGAAQQLDALSKRLGKLRGLSVVLRRRDHRPQAPVDVQAMLNATLPFELPGGIDGEAYCTRLYGKHLRFALEVPPIAGSSRPGPGEQPEYEGDQVWDVDAKTGKLTRRTAGRNNQ